MEELRRTLTSECKCSNFPTMDVMGFSYLWRSSVGAPSLNVYCVFCKEKCCLVTLEEMADSSDGVLPLFRVFSSSLDPGKTWHVLNAALCAIKPSTFCSSSSAKLFSDEYHFVDLSNLHGDGRVPALYPWFSSFRRTKKVHVATTFGLLLAILRQRTLQRRSVQKCR